MRIPGMILAAGLCLLASSACNLSDEGPAELRSTPNGVDFGDFLVGYGPYAATEVTVVNSGIFTINIEDIGICFITRMDC